MDYMARLQVLQGQKTWRAHEVPSFTAGALCPVSETPAQPVVDLLRIDIIEGRQVQQRLSEFDRDTLNSHWKLCGLPPARELMSSDEWVPYLVAFNELPQRPEGADWLFAVVPPHDPNQVARLAQEVTRQNHEARLKAAIERGEVVARLSDMTEPPAFMSLNHVVLTRSELVKFCDLLCIQVVDIPHFITSARPLEIPAALLALPGDARVSYEHNIALQRGSGITNAASYRDEIRDTIARQAEGHFTLNEAAQVLADMRPGLDPKETVKRFRLAHSKGELPIHQGESRFSLQAGETVRDFWDTVEVSELDAWLLASTGYGFPPADGVSERASIQPHPAATDFSLLATREKLVSAFGSFTGMKVSWFDSLSDSPALLAARKVKGSGGRGHTTEPWFCPYEVMRWVTGPKFKKGRRLSERTGWRLLKQHFPSVHAAHELEEPAD